MQPNIKSLLEEVTTEYIRSERYYALAESLAEHAIQSGLKEAIEKENPIPSEREEKVVRDFIESNELISTTFKKLPPAVQYKKL